MADIDNDYFEEEEEDDYVGPSHPPHHSRFRSGKSGNLAGRPKRIPSPPQLFWKELKKQIKIIIEGKVQKVMRVQAMIMQLGSMVARGDYRAIKLFLTLKHRASKRHGQLYGFEQPASSKTNLVAAWSFLTANSKLTIQQFGLTRCQWDHQARFHAKPARPKKARHWLTQLPNSSLPTRTLKQLIQLIRRRKTMTDMLIDNIKPAEALTDRLTAKGRERRNILSALSKLNRKAAPARNDLLPELKLMKLPIASLHTSERKMRKHSHVQIHEIAQSIATFGFCAPLLLGKNYEVIDGEARLEAAKLACLTEVPCIEIGRLTNAEQRSLRLAVNRLDEKAEWDLKELKIEMEELFVLDAPIAVMGFSADEIDQIILDDDANDFEEGPLEPESKSEPRAALGQVYQLGPRRLICGDATKPETYQHLFGSDANVKGNLVFTDVPYNVPIVGHVSGGDHRKFTMASGEMTNEEFLAFNKA